MVKNMLYRILGSSGSGKTEYMLSKMGECIKKGKKTLLIVPEQQSVDYEYILCNRFGNSCNMYCEVLNFERLPNRVARDFGGLAQKNIDKGGACALLSLVVVTVRERLSEYASVAGDPEFAKKLFALINRFKTSVYTPNKLVDLTREADISKNSKLCNKLRDIAVIYEEYQKHFDGELKDPRDGLTRLSAELKEKPFFADAHVFIDGYYTFTKQETDIIKEIIDQSANTYISFTVEDGRGLFEENKKCADRIKKMAYGSCEDILCGFSKRTEDKALLHIERNILRNNPPIFQGKPDSVKVIKTKNRFDEADAAAKEILDFVRSDPKNKFSDVAVLCRDTDKYQGILKSVFERNGISMYASSKENLLAKPLFAFICAGISVIAENFSLRSVKKYIKSGFTPLSVTESDVLLSYAESWNIRGKQWYSQEEWTMDPEGYREGPLTERGEKILSSVNRARKKLVPALSALRDTLSSKKLTVEQGIKGIYSHLVACDAEKMLLASAEEKLNRGDREGAEREIQLWNLLINIMDQLCAVCPDFSVDTKGLLALFKLTAECYSPGAIPASSDAVTFGSVALARAGNCKMTVILGAVEGEFPAAVRGNGFFNDEESLLLDGVGCDFADTDTKLMNTEHFFVYNAFSSPRERLVVIVPENEITGASLRGSVAEKALLKLFPSLLEEEISREDMLYSAGSIASFFPQIAEGEPKEKLRTVLRSAGVNFFENEPDVTITASRINTDLDSLALSPSKIEKYQLCPFSYFGTYLLHLREKKVFDWSSPDTGTFVHRILEVFLRQCLVDGKFCPPEDMQRERMVKELSSQLFLSLAPKDSLENKRFMHTYDGMLRTLLAVTKDLCNEFSKSDFLPVGFEYSIGLGSNPDMPPITYDVDGKTVILRGSIDRVDTYERDGIKYVRVTDYKTYQKTLSLDLVDNGLDTQMLHYLFAYCRHNGGTPAGALYYYVTLPFADGVPDATVEEIEASAFSKLKRTGIIIEDIDILRAMSSDLSHLPVCPTSSGVRKSQNLMSSEGFCQLNEKLDLRVTEMAKKMFCGEMDIAPNDHDGKAEPCKYCKLKPICRHK